MEKSLKRPGGGLASRPLHFFWLIDCSGSMSGEKIAVVNNAIQSVIPDMRDEANNNPNAQLYIRTMEFSSGANWINSTPVPIDEFVWNDLTVNGLTDMGKAFELLAAQLDIPPMSDRALPPVIVLLSDGMPTDDYEAGLNQLLTKPWGKKAVKIAIAIGKDADYEALSRFTGNKELVLQANNSKNLVKMIKWASTAVSAVSSPSSMIKTDNQSSSSYTPVVVAMNNLVVDDSDTNDVW